jgi:hypothetical protein
LASAKRRPSWEAQWAIPSRRANQGRDCETEEVQRTPQDAPRWPDLNIACKQKFVLDSYEDAAVGHMEKNADGKLAITRVELRPKITWSGNRRPSAEELDKMHHAAHENCFIANSVKTNVTVAER